MQLRQLQKKSEKIQAWLGYTCKPNDSSAALLPTELSSQLGVVGLCVNSDIFPRKTNQNHVHVFFFILRVHVTIIVISIFGKKKKERLFCNFSDLLDR